MPLQTSGPISLNDIHQEVGGSSGTSVSLNDADVRGLIGVGSGGTNSMSAYYGASAVQLQPTLALTTRGSAYPFTSGKFTFYYIGFNGYSNNMVVVPTNYGNLQQMNLLLTMMDLLFIMPSSFGISATFFNALPKTFLRTNTNVNSPTNKRDYYSVNPADLGYTGFRWKGVTKTLKPATLDSIPAEGNNSSLTGGVSVSKAWNTGNTNISFVLSLLGPAGGNGSANYPNATDPEMFGFTVGVGQGFNSDYAFIGS